MLITFFPEFFVTGKKEIWFHTGKLVGALHDKNWDKKALRHQAKPKK